MTQSTILIIDAEPAKLDVLRASLTEAGYKIIVATSGESALKRVTYIKPDIILLDVRLPGMDGYEVCRQLHTNSDTKEIPVIFMTALTGISNEIKGLQLGAVDYISKPIRVERVLARVQTQLTLQKSHLRLAKQNSQLQQEISRHEQLEKEHQKTLNLQNIILDNAMIGVFLIVKRTFVWINKRGEEMFGYGSGEMNGHSAKIIYHSLEGYQQRGAEIYSVLVKGKTYYNETQLKRKDGSSFWGSLTSKAIDPHDLSQGTLWLLDDITDRKQMELILRDSEERYRRLVENAPVGILSIDTQGNIIDVNPILLDILFSSSVEATKTINVFTFPPLVQAGVSAEFQRCLETEEMVMSEHLYTTKWGKQVYFAIHLTPIHNHDVSISGVQAIIRGTTKRKEAEIALEQSEQKHRRLVETANCIILEMDTAGKITFLNRFAQTFFGYSEPEILGRNVSGTIVPETEMSGRDLGTLIADIQANPDQYRHNENENMTKSGQRVWVKWSNEVIYDDEKKIVGLLCVGVDITERKQAEESVRESESKFRNFVEQSTDGITLVNEQGVVVEWNDSVAFMTGIGRTEVLGTLLWDVQFQFLPEKRKNLVIYEQFKSKIETALKTGQASWLNRVNETTYKHLDGSIRMVQQRFFPIKTDNGFWIGSISTDITEYRQAEESIKETNRNLEARVYELATLNRIAQMVTMVSELQPALDGVTQQIAELLNIASCALALFNDEQTELTVVSNHLRDPNEPSTVGVTLPIVADPLVLRIIEQKQTVTFLNVQTNPLSKPLHEIMRKRQIDSLLAVPLLIRGQVIGVISIAKHITDPEFNPSTISLVETIAGQIAGAIENARLFNAAEYARQEAETANRAKSIFLANMSHELRTPLNAILGFSQLMGYSTNLDPEEQKNLKIIRRSGEHLLNLINDVLDMSKIEVGRTVLNEKEFNMYHLLDDVEGMFRLKAEEKGLQLIFECDASVPQYVRTDEGKLRQVLLNLLGNALKFTQEGGISVRVRQLTVENRAGKKIELQFEVEDSGEGIVPAELDSLFKAFVQTESGRKSQQGTGLGLPISRKFVQMMGGDITVESEVDRETVFRFRIQAEAVEGTEIETAQPTRRVIALAPDQPHYRILIVDDRESSRLLLLKVLALPGFELREAKNGQEAVEIWEKWEPQLIFMDIRMPVMDGYEATKRIKDRSKGQATAIIAMTANVFEDEQSVVLSVGGDDFIHKPFKEAEILEMVHQHLGVRYVYQEDTDSPIPERSERDIRKALTPEALSTLPTELLIEMEEASVQGDMDKVESLIEAISSHDAAVADALALLAADFDYEKILKLIQ